jgi:hypothetical protein
VKGTLSAGNQAADRAGSANSDSSLSGFSA